MSKYSNYLITGATGSFGQKFVDFLLKNTTAKRIIIFSRDEQKQFNMKNNIPEKYHDRLRFFIGDVRDLSRLEMAVDNVDVIVHAAAMKIVTIAEYDPFECVKTNINGAQNIVTTALNKGVKKVIALSTDKACNPVNLYGATKLVSDKIFVAANHLSGNKFTRFSIVRYGNVLGSRGSVLEVFNKLKKEGKKVFIITDREMTRFSITIEEGVKFVMKSLQVMQGGEIFVPKIPSIKILELANVLEPNFEIKITGIRPGEKLHEKLISKNDSRNTIEFKDYFIIKPEIILSNYRNKKYSEKFKSVPLNFEYVSNNNNSWLVGKSLLAVIKKIKFTN